MKIKHFRLSMQARDQLIRLKMKTGFENWNVLCRWAFCLSLAESSPPTPIDPPADSNVELTWGVFAGEADELFRAVLIERCVRDGVELNERELGRNFRRHLHRGISYLASPGTIQSVSDLLRLTLEPQKDDIG